MSLLVMSLGPRPLVSIILIRSRVPSSLHCHWPNCSASSLTRLVASAGCSSSHIAAVNICLCANTLPNFSWPVICQTLTNLKGAKAQDLDYSKTNIEKLTLSFISSVPIISLGCLLGWGEKRQILSKKSWNRFKIVY